MSAGRPQPAYVELPYDLLGQPTDGAAPAVHPVPEAVVPPAEEVRRAVALLRDLARRP